MSNGKSLENFKSFIKKYIVKIEYPGREIGIGIFCEIPLQKLPRIVALVTNFKLDDINSDDLYKDIKLSFFDTGKQIQNDSLGEVYQDEQYGTTIINVGDDIIDKERILKIDEDFYSYENMKVNLIYFPVDNKLDFDCDEGLIPEPTNNFEDIDEENNHFEIKCDNKKKTTSGFMLFDKKIMGLYYGDSNEEGKNGNSGLYLYNVIFNFYGKKNIRFKFKRKRKDNKGTNNINNSVVMNSQSNLNNMNNPTGNYNLSQSYNMPYQQNNNQMNQNNNNNNMSYQQNNNQMNQGQNMSYQQNNNQMNQNNNNMSYQQNNNQMNQNNNMSYQQNNNQMNQNYDMQYQQNNNQMNQNNNMSYQQNNNQMNQNNNMQYQQDNNQINQNMSYQQNN